MNTLETVFVPRNLTRNDLERARASMLRRFYLRPGMLLRKLAAAVRRPGLIGGMLKSLATLAGILLTGDKPGK